MSTSARPPSYLYLFNPPTPQKMLKSGEIRRKRNRGPAQRSAALPPPAARGGGSAPPGSEGNSEQKTKLNVKIELNGLD